MAAEAERRKRLKYANLNFSYFFVPVAVETLGVIGPESHAFLQDLAGRVRSIYCNISLNQLTRQ